MQATAPVYEQPSRLSQGLIVGLGIAVVLMAGWLAVTILSSPVTTTTAVETNPPVATPLSAADGAAPGAARPPAPSNAVPFDWPEEFNAASAPPKTALTTALPLSPAELPGARSPGGARWPAAPPVPDANDRSFPSRPPPSQAAGTSATDAIVDLLSPPPGAAVPLPRPVPSLRR